MTITTDQLLATLKSLNGLFATAAKFTATTIDDQASAAIALVLDNPLLAGLLHLVLHDQQVLSLKGSDRDLAIHNAMAAGLTEEIDALLAKIGIDVPTLQTYFTLLVRLVLTALGLRS